MRKRTALTILSIGSRIINFQLFNTIIKANSHKKSQSSYIYICYFTLSLSYYISKKMGRLQLVPCLVKHHIKNHATMYTFAQYIVSKSFCKLVKLHFFLLQLQKTKPSYPQRTLLDQVFTPGCLEHILEIVR